MPSLLFLSHAGRCDSHKGKQLEQLCYPTPCTPLQFTAERPRRTERPSACASSRRPQSLGPGRRPSALQPGHHNVGSERAWALRTPLASPPHRQHWPSTPSRPQLAPPHAAHGASVSNTLAPGGHNLTSRPFGVPKKPWQRDPPEASQRVCRNLPLLVPMLARGC